MKQKPLNPIYYRLQTIKKQTAAIMESLGASSPKKDKAPKEAEVALPTTGDVAQTDKMDPSASLAAAAAAAINKRKQSSAGEE